MAIPPRGNGWGHSFSQGHVAPTSKLKAHRNKKVKVWLGLFFTAHPQSLHFEKLWICEVQERGSKEVHALETAPFPQKNIKDKAWRSPFLCQAHHIYMHTQTLFRSSHCCVYVQRSAFLFNLPIGKGIHSGLSLAATNASQQLVQSYPMWEAEQW